MSANQRAALQAKQQARVEEASQEEAPKKEFELTIEFCGAQANRRDVGEPRAGASDRAGRHRRLPRPQRHPSSRARVHQAGAAPADVLAAGGRAEEGAALREVRRGISMQAIPLTAEKVAAMTLTLTPLKDEPEFKFSSTRSASASRSRRRSAASCWGSRAEDVERLRSLGEAALIEEITTTATHSSTHGWTDADWVCYLTGTAPRPKAGAGRRRRRAAKELRRRGRRRGRTTCASRLPAGRSRRPRGSPRPRARAAPLLDPVFKSVNRPLHDGCSPERPHPYPALVVQLVDALARLRVAQAEARAAAVKRAEAAKSATVDPEDEEAVAAVAARPSMRRSARARSSGAASTHRRRVQVARRHRDLLPLEAATATSRRRPRSSTPPSSSTTRSPPAAAADHGAAEKDSLVGGRPARPSRRRRRRRPPARASARPSRPSS